jgi:hypothetical protein
LLINLVSLSTAREILASTVRGKVTMTFSAFRNVSEDAKHLVTYPSFHTYIHTRA